VNDRECSGTSYPTFDLIQSSNTMQRKDAASAHHITSAANPFCPYASLAVQKGERKLFRQQDTNPHISHTHTYQSRTPLLTYHTHTHTHIKAGHHSSHITHSHTYQGNYPGLDEGVGQNPVSPYVHVHIDYYAQIILRIAHSGVLTTAGFLLWFCL
jgi:hypothetical protein